VTPNSLHRKQLQTLSLYHRECQLTSVEGTVDRIRSLLSPHSSDPLMRSQPEAPRQAVDQALVQGKIYA
jgi:hypothetical protein